MSEVRIEGDADHAARFGPHHLGVRLRVEFLGGGGRRESNRGSERVEEVAAEDRDAPATAAAVHAQATTHDGGTPPLAPPDPRWHRR